MSEIIVPIGQYLKNTPSIFEILENTIAIKFPKFQAFLKTIQEKVFPNFDELERSLEKMAQSILDSKNKENNEFINSELQALEKEYIWANYVELASQNRANLDLITKLESEISINSKKLEEIVNKLVPIQNQYNQKYEIERTEFKLFRVLNSELQILFNEQNQIIRKLQQTENQLNDPKAKKTPEETTQLETTIADIRQQEKRVREQLPQKQKKLEEQRLVHQAKERELRPIKAQLDSLISEQQKLKQLISGDTNRLNDKRNELEIISKKTEEFSTLNSKMLADKPPSIRTKNFLEEKLKNLRSNAQLKQNDNLDGHSLNNLTTNFILQLQKILNSIEYPPDEDVTTEIEQFSKNIVELINRIAPDFSQVMKILDKSGGVQVRSLIFDNGHLQFSEKAMEGSLASTLAFIVAISKRDHSKIKINTKNLTPDQKNELKTFIKTLQAHPDFSSVVLSEV